ncbi:MAG: 3-deoxy-7-phosphoheptulonate synthase [Flavobacteriales bacterium]|nr:3-deoxy-7-phosphoheptulonate synthase [Flavobacteriales bacterium]
MKPSTLIAGPCSAETREQVLKTAEGLSQIPLDYFRAGIWKPRTRPGEFEGIGDAAIPWMQEVKAKFGLKISTEVAKAEHVEAVLRAGFDMIWIGARSTANPFTVQEIADALQGVDIPVMVKNPTNPDLKLWIGAIERVQKAGIKEITAIHRGFSVYEKTLYRNNPNWQIPIDLKQELPTIPLICDPSHIGGRDYLLLEIAQRAFDLKYDGLMIETHCSPKDAWTDAKQQITPVELSKLLNALKIRGRQEIEEEEILNLRSQLTSKDEEIIRLLRERMEVSGLIGAYKKQHNIAILQNNQWEESLRKNLDRAKNADLSPQFSNDLFRLIHQESIRIQAEILSEKKNE